MNRRLFLVPAALVLAGCAALPPGKRDPRDPFERMNRGTYVFNTETDKLVLRPAAKAWRAVVPVPVRKGLGNFLSNLGYPSTVINDVLQGQFADANTAAFRFIVNTVVGFGFFDPAARLGLGRRDQSFSDTLARWGVPSGPYLVLPLAGPSSVRDAPALVVNDYFSPRHYLNDAGLRYGLAAVGIVELRTQLLATDSVILGSFDPYALTRNAWLQRRDFLRRDRTSLDGDGSEAGNATPEPDDSPPLEEPPDSPTEAPAEAPPPAGQGPVNAEAAPPPAPPAAPPGR
jgi:phospholipid-binding lipoprotein MlaA